MRQLNRLDGINLDARRGRIDIVFREEFSQSSCKGAEVVASEEQQDAASVPAIAVLVILAKSEDGRIIGGTPAR